jgi:hypothetical protein
MEWLQRLLLPPGVEKFPVERECIYLICEQLLLLT